MRDIYGKFQNLSIRSKLTFVMVVDTLRRSKVPKVGMAAALLETNSDNLQHLNEIVAKQQSYAKVGGVFETLSLDGLVEDALSLHFGGLDRKGITVEKHFSPLAPVKIDRHKVLQIVINLIQNAAQALEEVTRDEKRISISIDDAGEGYVTIKVADNGTGIYSQNMMSIFSHGFTTREEGHGFGLHHGAIAAREMGGSLKGFSEGPNCGATFTLTLPRRGNQRGSKRVGFCSNWHKACSIGSRIT